MLHASDVLNIIEIIAPGSRRIDMVDKRNEYADAGIPHYWVIDIDVPISLVACHRAEPRQRRVTGTFTTEEPFPVTIDLERLR